MSSDSVVILGACRTAIGTFGGSLKDVSAVDLGAAVIREAIRRAGVRAADTGDVILGCVLQAGNGMNVARQAALRAGVPVEVPAETVNRVCGSGLQAVVHAVEAIKVGYTPMIVAGGTESMSNAPYLLPRARWGLRMGNAEIVDSMLGEGLTCAIGACHMGTTAEEIASRYGVSRSDQDAFASQSQRRAQEAIATGRFRQEIVSLEVPQKKGEVTPFEVDEHPRAGVTAEKLGALKPVFKKEGTVTPGNASGINDGAAALVVASEDWAREHGRQPMARVLSYASIGVEPAVMGMGPAAAIPRALDRARLRLEDIGLIELNEAFAAQALAVMRELHMDPARVNVNGGAIALGHPIGASGARVLTTLLHAMAARSERYGLASLCIGGGMGIAMVVERL